MQSILNRGLDSYIAHVGVSGEGTPQDPLIPSVGISDGAKRSSHNTVFGERTVGTRRADIAAQFQYGYPASSANTDTSNGGTISIVESKLTLSTSTNIAGTAKIANRKALRYLPGHEAYCFFTAVFSAGKADSYQRAGLYDDNDGFYIGYEDDIFYASRRRNGVDYREAIDLSSIYDAKKDGVFDPTKGNVYKVSFGYLGFATITFEVLTPSGGWVVMHKIEYPNSSTDTHITNTNITPRAEVANTGNDTDINLQSGSFCAGIVNGAGEDPAARRFAYDRLAVAAVPTEQMVVTLRSRDTHAGITNNIQSMITYLGLNTDLNKSTVWELRKNMTITNLGVATWSDINANDSTIEYSIDATVTAGSGDVELPIVMGKIDKETIVDLGQQEISLLPQDTLTLLVNMPGGTSGTLDMAIRWKELF